MAHDAAGGREDAQGVMWQRAVIAATYHAQLVLLAKVVPEMRHRDHELGGGRPGRHVDRG